MAAELIDLYLDKALGQRVVTGIQQVISDSFAHDRSRVTMNETKRRFEICESLFRELRAISWSWQRILDELPTALRARLDGAPWEPGTRNVWAPAWITSPARKM